MPINYRKLANLCNSILHMSLSMKAQNQILEIALKDYLSVELQDIPVNTVSTEYHDKLMADWNVAMVKLKTHHEELRVDWKRRLDDAHVEIRALIQDLDEATKPGKKRESKDTLPDSTETRNPAQLAAEGKYIVSPDPVPGPGLPYKAEKETTVNDVNAAEDMKLAADEKPRLIVRSKRPKNCSLTVPEVWQVRRYIKAGRRNMWIEKKMGMSSAAVSQFRNGRTYTKVPKEPQRKPIKVHVGEGVIEQKGKRVMPNHK